MHNKAFMITHKFYIPSYLYSSGLVLSRDRGKQYWIPGKSRFLFSTKLSIYGDKSMSLMRDVCVNFSHLVPTGLISLPFHLGFHDDPPCKLSM
jgi:hypothetical protein